MAELSLTFMSVCRLHGQLVAVRGGSPFRDGEERLLCPLCLHALNLNGDGVDHHYYFGPAKFGKPPRMDPLMPGLIVPVFDTLGEALAYHDDETTRLVNTLLERQRRLEEKLTQ
jgi:hypothetical protein